MAFKAQPKRICFLAPNQSDMLIEIWYGVMSALKLRRGFRVVRTTLNEEGVKMARDWRPDVVIAHANFENFLHMVQSFGCPAVNTSGFPRDIPFPTVTLDNHATGRMAADHLLEKGYNAFAFIGQENAEYSRQRLAGFRERIGDAGTGGVERCPVQFWEIGMSDPRQHMDEAIALAGWLRHLPEGVGIFCADDPLAQTFVDHVGMVDESLLTRCALLSGHHGRMPTFPGISGVMQSEQTWGMEAARVALALLDAEAEPPPPLTLIPPKGIFALETTAGRFAADHEVRNARAFIHREVHKGINVQDVVNNASTLKRRALERRFQEAFGKTLLEEIQQARIERARLLLRESEMTMVEVAKQSGFTDPKHMKRVFIQTDGKKPSAYR